MCSHHEDWENEHCSTTQGMLDRSRNTPTIGTRRWCNTGNHSMTTCCRHSAHTGAPTRLLRPRGPEFIVRDGALHPKLAIQGLADVRLGHRMVESGERRFLGHTFAQNDGNDSPERDRTASSWNRARARGLDAVAGGEKYRCVFRSPFTHYLCMLITWCVLLSLDP